MHRRRFIALAAAFAVAFGALWPLVSAAKPRDPAIPSFICSQAGGYATHPAAPSEAIDDFHCPLCIASADGVVPAIAPVPQWHAVATIVVEAPGQAATHRSFNAHPPPSRGPPHLS